MNTLLAERLATAAAKAKKPLHKIEFKKDMRRSEIGGKYLMNPGGFDVYVNGKHWGRTQSESHGPRGATHYVCQIGSPGSHHQRCHLRVPGERPKFRMRTEYFFTRSENAYLASLKPGETPKPFMARLEDAVLDAIARGALRDPAVIAAEEHREAERVRRKQAAEAQRERRKWEAKARECLEPLAGHVPTSKLADALGKIVDAMKWAQNLSDLES